MTISIREQREAVEYARDWHEGSAMHGPLAAAALTLAKVERGEYVLKDNADISISWFLP